VLYLQDSAMLGNTPKLLDAEEVSGSNPLSPTTLRGHANYLVSFLHFEPWIFAREVCTWRLLGYPTAKS